MLPLCSFLCIPKKTLRGLFFLLYVVFENFLYVFVKIFIIPSFNNRKILCLDHVVTSHKKFGKKTFLEWCNRHTQAFGQWEGALHRCLIQM